MPSQDTTSGLPLRLYEVFWANVDTQGICWIWQGGRQDEGYGRVSVNGQFCYAHRVAWALCHGPVPEGLHVLHHCDQPACVRPSHLFVGTNLDNIADKLAKGRQYRGARNPIPPRTRRPVILSGKLDYLTAQVIRVRYAAGGISQRALAHQYGITQASLWKILAGRSYAKAVSVCSQKDSTAASILQPERSQPPGAVPRISRNSASGCNTVGPHETPVPLDRQLNPV